MSNLAGCVFNPISQKDLSRQKKPLLEDKKRFVPNLTLSFPLLAGEDLAPRSVKWNWLLWLRRAGPSTTLDKVSRR
jgi:hypothetical protein